MPVNEQAKQEMLEYCSDYYQTNTNELEKIDEFRRTYSREKAIEWYTDECFLYKLLNKALRTENVDLLYLFRFYTIDLCQQLENEQVYLQERQKLTLYRCQIMSKQEFEKLKSNTGILISTNGFFSTTKNRNIALRFAAPSRGLDLNTLVLFEIKVDKQLSTTIVADIDKYSRNEGEEEYLFSLCAVFRIDAVEFDLSLNLWKTHMTATDDGSKQREDYLTYISQQTVTGEYTPTILFGRLLLCEMGQIEKAEKYFNMLLKTLPYDHADMPAVYNNIGNVLRRKGELNLALENYTKSYNLCQQRLTSDNTQLAESLNNIALIHRQKGNYDLAMMHYRQVFAIYEKNYSGDHVTKAKTMDCIGMVYKLKKDYIMSLDYLHQAFRMFERVLPAEHPVRAQTLGNIGLVYEDQKDFDSALQYYQLQLEMEEKILSSEHSNLTRDLDSIVRILKKKGQHETALNFCQKKLSTQRANLPKNHIRIGHMLKTLGDIFRDKEQSSKEALECYEQALAIFENCSPTNHSGLIDCLIAISGLYSNANRFDDALTNRFKAFDFQQRIQSPSNPSLAWALKDIGRIYFCMNKYIQALDYYMNALKIFEKNYDHEHKHVKNIQNQIATVRNKIDLAGKNNVSPFGTIPDHDIRTNDNGTVLKITKSVSSITTTDTVKSRICIVQ
ncbi:unnamed protein product [Didymodactylos carnosus]|uniref:Uncharacterized protein n=1 Tax=Didymodactylos carnosus TaxID=1234261 RepID=A0A8S2DHR0_9BILA|nr:unnamed protein product [Didymodactylos carnosus]CAF3677853.1 unnamed protein product [Didymodactylos carnosus]